MKYMLAMLLLLSIGASAQIQLDSIIVKQRFKLNGYRVIGISNDTASSSQDSSKLITEKAAKNLASTKVQYIDTAPALAAYQAALNSRLRYTDTAALLAAYRTALNARLKFTDTSAMLSAYITALVARVRYSDTASMLTAYRSALLARMNYTDSSGMLTAYQTAINARLKFTDTASMLAAYQTALNARQVTLVSGTNIKTINGSSVLGSGNIAISANLGTVTVGSTIASIPVWKTTNTTLGSDSVFCDTVNHRFLFGSQTNNTGARVTINSGATASGFPSTSGTTFSNGVLRLTDNQTQNALDFGFAYSSSSPAWIQARYNNSSATTSLILQPNNGGVVVGNPLGTVQYTDGLQVLGNSGNGNFYVTSPASTYTSNVNFTYGTNIYAKVQYSPSNNNFTLGTTSANGSGWWDYIQNNGTNMLGVYSDASVLIQNGGTFTSDGINKLQVSGSIKGTAFNDNSTTTTLSGATSGTAVFRQPAQGGLKKVVIYCSALLGATITYTFPTAFTQTPAITSTSSLSSSVVTTLTTTGVVITGSTSTGIIIIEGI